MFVFVWYMDLSLSGSLFFLLFSSREFVFVVSTEEEMWVCQKCFYHLQKQSKAEFFLGGKDNFFVILSFLFDTANLKLVSFIFLFIF